MPAQLSTVLYISEYKEKTSSGFFVVNATGYTRLEEEGDRVQKFNIVAFYPIDETKPCYLPKLSEGQILSISNSKFTKGENGELDLILTSASILNIPPEELPVHQITVVGIATATNTAVITEIGVQVECIVSEYLSKEKSVDMPVTLFHPSGSRFTNQTTTIKRGSSIFFSGALTLIEEKLYLELHNFSFIHNQTSTPSTRQMPWSKSLTKTLDNPTPTIAQSIHKFNKNSSTFVNPINKKTIEQDNPTSPILETPRQTRKNTLTSTKTTEQDNPTSPILETPRQTRKNPLTPPTSTIKRKTRSSYRNNNKMQKLADIASDKITIVDSDLENED